MSSHWLQLGDRLIIDGADCTATEVLVGRTDRLTFQKVAVRPELGGEGYSLLQVEDEGLYELSPTDPGGLDDSGLSLSWDATVRTERASAGGRRKYGRGEVRWYDAEDGRVALCVDTLDDDYAVLGVPLEPARVDLSFT